MKPGEGEGALLPQQLIAERRGHSHRENSSSRRRLR